MLKGEHSSFDTKVNVHKWIKNKPETFYRDGLKKWIEFWKNCVTLNDDYVENLTS